MVKNLVARTLAGALLLLGAGQAGADSEALSPRATGVGEALRAAATGSLATSLNPAGLALGRSYVLEGAYGYRPDDDAHIQAVSVCDSVTTRVGACLFYSHLSADPSEEGDRSLHEVGITSAVPLGALGIGITQRYVTYKESVMEPVPVDSSHKGFLLDAGMTYRIIPTLTAAFVGYNLVGADDGRYGRAIGGGLAFNAMSRLLMSADARYDFAKEAARYGGGVELMLPGADGHQAIPLRAGYIYDAESKGSFVTGGLGFVTPRVGLDLAARKQVSHGSELMMQLSLRIFLPTLQESHGAWINKGST
jgi:hypothetical protein